MEKRWRPSYQSTGVGERIVFRFIFLFLLLTLGSTLLGKILVLCENIQLAQTSDMTLCKHESTPSAKSQSTIRIGSRSDKNLVF